MAGCAPSSSRSWLPKLELPLPPRSAPPCARQACGSQRPSLTSARSRGSGVRLGTERRKNLAVASARSPEGENKGEGTGRRGRARVRCTSTAGISERINLFEVGHSCDLTDTLFNRVTIVQLDGGDSPPTLHRKQNLTSFVPRGRVNVRRPGPWRSYRSLYSICVNVLHQSRIRLSLLQVN